MTKFLNDSSEQQVDLVNCVRQILFSLTEKGPLLRGLDLRDHGVTAYICAVLHSLHELGEISASANFNEEDRTASLIGHLATHFGWYGLMWRLTNPKNGSQLQHLCWSYQRKKEEAEKGGDFGLAIPISEDQYRIAFFQAKLITANDHKTIDIHRPPTGYGSEEAAKKDPKCADIRQVANEGLTLLMADSVPHSVSGREHHQLVKLAIVDEKGHRAVSADAPIDWVHYVLWPQEQKFAPICLSLGSVITIVRKQFEKRLPKENFLKFSIEDAPSHSSFAQLLIDGLDGTGSGWLTVDRSKAEQLIGGLTQLCPNWLVVDETGTSGGWDLIRALEAMGNNFIPMAMNAAVGAPPLVVASYQDALNDTTPGNNLRPR